MAEHRANEAGGRSVGEGPVDGPLSLRSFLRRYSLPVACGAALALAFPTYHLFPLAWVALVPVIRRARLAESPWQAGIEFLIAGFSFHLVLLQWLMANVYWAGGWAWWGYVALSFFLALFWFVMGALWRGAALQLRWLPGEISLPLLWGAMEYTQSWAFTGFGWGAIAYSQASDLWLAQWAAIGGTPLVSAIVIGFGTLLANLRCEKNSRIARCVIAFGLVIGAHIVGAMMMGSPDYARLPMKAALVQADFPLEMKWDPEYAIDMVRKTADKSRMLTNAERVDLIVWPEALIMEDIETPGIIDEVSTLARDTGAYLFAGAHRSNPKTEGSMNSAYLVNPDGVIEDHYDKIHLAPFGEYVPLNRYLPFISKVVPAIGDIERGAEQKVFQTGLRRLGPLICFEVIFPAMAEHLRRDGADYLVVVTNLGWFGASNAIAQELEIARMRAIETRLPVVQCANSGISGVFDPWGRFEVVDVYFKDATTAFKARLSSPSQTIMSRFGGVVSVAAPSTRPWEKGPVLVPKMMLIAAIAICVVSWGRFVMSRAIRRRAAGRSTN